MKCNPKKVDKKEGEWRCYGCGRDLCTLTAYKKEVKSKIHLKKHEKIIKEGFDEKLEKNI